MRFSLFYPVRNLPALVTDPHSEASRSNSKIPCLHLGIGPHSKRKDNIPACGGSISCQTHPSAQVLAIIVTVYSAPDGLGKGEAGKLNVF